MGDFTGKRGLVLGVANRRSIAWSIAQKLAEGGASLAFTFQGERIEQSVRDLAGSISSPLVTECDVRADEDLERVFSEVAETFGGELDLLVHSVAFADARDLEGRFTDTPRERFWLALDVSAYSLVACARAAEPLMDKSGGGSILTMTYLGGERAVPHYNVMGVAKSALDSSVKYLAWDLGQKDIRVNAISAGPVRTLAARSIAGFPTMEAIVARLDVADPGTPEAVPEAPPVAVVRGEASREARAVGEDDAGRERYLSGLLVERPRRPGSRVDELQAGGDRFLRPARVPTGDGQEPVTEPVDCADRPLAFSFGEGGRLHPLAQAPEQGDRLWEAVVGDLHRPEVYVGDWCAAADDERASAARIDGEAWHPAPIDGRASARDLLHPHAGGDRGDPGRTNTAVRAGDDEAGGADRSGRGAPGGH